jgi:hypothetical protein
MMIDRWAAAAAALMLSTAFGSGCGALLTLRGDPELGRDFILGGVLFGAGAFVWLMRER